MENHPKISQYSITIDHLNSAGKYWLSSMKSMVMISIISACGREKVGKGRGGVSTSGDDQPCCSPIDADQPQR
jgi:hypothetical protein